MIENKRFQFDNGGEMNGHWIFKALTDQEKRIAYQLGKGGRELGWSPDSLNAAHIKRCDVDRLVDEGIIIKSTLLQLSREFTKNPDNRQRFNDLEETYGFTMIPPEDRDFFWDFVHARRVVKNGSKPNNLKTQYRVVDDLLPFIEILF